uniref:Immunoglobulin domain-containing protein n=1 Tax=Astyanax mexicanus TaxID=7994 RepID=W5KM22_ASTMX
MTARVGSSVVLPCDCTAVCSNQSSNEGLHIEWRTFSETVFERLGEEHYEGEGYEGRVDVPEDKLKKGNCSLFLKEVKAEDAGVYQSYLLVKREKRPLQSKRVFIQSVDLSVHEISEQFSGNVPADHIFHCPPLASMISSRRALLLWCITCTAQSQTFMSVGNGSSAVLPCDWTAVSSTPSSDQNLYIEWRTFSGTVFESLGEEHYEGEGYEGRVDVPEDKLKKGNCSLVLKEVKAEDAGVYQSYLLVKQEKRSLQSKRVFIQSVELSVFGKNYEILWACVKQTFMV